MSKSSRKAINAKKPAAKKTVSRSPAKMDQEEGETTVVNAIAAMPDPDRTLGERLHSIIKANAPNLSPRLWYGMPAWAKEGKVVCFFQSAAKFKTRYATLGFSHEAQLDEGSLWPVAFALKEISADVEARITSLVKRAVG